MTNKKDWIWMPHVAHFICGKDCKFHLATYFNGYIVSTIGGALAGFSGPRNQGEIRKRGH
ncbi:hypothetical protein IID10_20485 [candidate division KSB1 bacterium]|nr:hypothetical protein [candidate division KSB1 bacterium]